MEVNMKTSHEHAVALRQCALFVENDTGKHIAKAMMEAADFLEQSSLQSRVQPWMMACFGPEISGDKLERGDRFLEEAIELLQSVDYPRERIYALIEYVYGRDQGEINQEVGGVMITLAAFCLAHGQDMHEAGETELARIWTKVEKIRAKQAAKPTGSALPIAV
jgi:NTP pyrophosphatase (non-canonical NTP hydrolase)